MDYWKIVRKQISGLKDLATMSFADLGSAGITMIFWFYLASVSSPEEFGELHYYIGIAGMGAYLGLIATQNTVTVYVAKDIKLKSTLFFISLIGGAIASIITFVLFYRYDISFLVLALMLSYLSIGDLVGRKLFREYSKYIILQKSLLLILGFTFFFTIGIQGVIFAIALSYTVYIKIALQGVKESSFDLPLLKTKLGFILNNYGLNLSTSANGHIDKLIIGPLLGFAILGNYSLAIQFIGVLTMFSHTVFKYMLPHDSTNVSTKNIKKITIIVSACISVIAIILSPLLIPEFFPKYTDAITAIQVISLAIIPGTFSLFYQSKFLGLEKSRYLIKDAILFAASLIVGIIVLGTWYNILGVASAHVISQIISLGFLYYMNKKMEKENE